MTARRRLSLQGFTTTVMLGALLYVGAMWAHAVARFQPLVAQVTADGNQESQRFERIRARAARHSLVRAQVAAELGAPRLARDTLEAVRRNLQGAIITDPAGAQLLLPPSSSQALVDAVESAGATESQLRTVLIAAIAALELGDRAAAARAVARADSLDASLTYALAEATDLAVAEVWARQRRLAEIAEEEGRLTIIWMLVGLVIFGTAIEVGRRRLRQPLRERIPLRMPHHEQMPHGLGPFGHMR